MTSTLTSQSPCSLTLDALIQNALQEDMPAGDLTTDWLITKEQTSTAIIASQQPLVVSGIKVACRVFELLDSRLNITCHVEDGDCLSNATTLMTIEGATQSILKGERLALNFLQHLCGIATLTYQYASTISRTKAQITHTRKTLPGLRALETQAVLHGGGILHRQSLSEFAMIKDNHLAASESLEAAIEKLRQSLPSETKIEVECDSLTQVEAALNAKADVILLDNMSLENLRKAVTLVNGRIPLEASGGVTLKTVQAIAETGVDIISTSQLTMSAPAADLHLELQE